MTVRAARRRVAAAACLAGALIVGTADDTRAQGSPIVPLDDPVYAYVDALLARGQLDGLVALERPYTAAALLRASDGATARPGVVGGWASALQRRVRLLYATEPAAGTAPDTGTTLRGVVAAGLVGTAESSARRELLLADDAGGVHPGAHVRAAATVGPIAVGTRLLLDQRLVDDPEYDGITDGGVALRAEDAYVSAQWRYGELFLGRTARNWGPPQLTGLVIGGYAFSYDHLYARLGTERLRLLTMVARLDEGPGLFDPVVQRYLSVHRLAGRWRGLEAALTESYVYSGADRGFEPAVINPLAPVLLAHYNEEDERGNVSFALDLLLRTRRGVFAAQAMLDDYQFESGAATTEEPPSYGVTLSAEGLPLAGEHRGFLSYTRATNLLYRTVDPGDAFILHGLSLGRGSTDYDELRLGVELALLPQLPLRVYAARRRQGEGDYRLPFPPVEDYPTTPGFLAGRVARVTRVGVAGAGAPTPGVGVSFDLGYNAVSGFDAAYAIDGLRPLAGSGLAGRVRVSVEPGALRGRFTLR